MFSKTLCNKVNLLNYSKKTFAVNEKALKNRIKTVSSIAKITKAMKMVSSSKMKADLGRLNAGKSFGHETLEKMFVSDQYMQKRNNNNEEANKILYVPFTSDRGLCGGINSGIVREIKSLISKSPNRSQCGIYVVGDKGSSALSRPFADIMKRSVFDLCTPMNYTTAAAIAHDISDQGKNYDKIVLVFNTFNSAISSTITKTELMTRPKFLDMMSYGKKYIMKTPDCKSANPAFYDLYVASNVYKAILNSIASEQSARMAAMENASKNAKEIVDKLLIQYNKARQARITMELVEIISGASAV